MINSTLNPQSIVKDSPANLSSFGDFITGGNLNSSSILNTSANKIVNFNRPQVVPVTPDVNNLISNISTNILNVVNNSIENTTSITNNLKDTLQKLKLDFYSSLDNLTKKFNFFEKKLSQKNLTPKTIEPQILERLVLQKQDLENQIQNIESSVKTIEPEVLDKLVLQKQDFENRIENIQSKLVNFDPQVFEKLVLQKQDLENQIQNIESSVKTIEPEVLDKLVLQKQDLENQIQNIESSVKTIEPQILDKVASQKQSFSPQIDSPSVEVKTPVTQVQEIVKNIQVEVSNVLDNTIRNFSKDYQDKVKGFDDNRPNNVLSKFLNLYKNAVGFISFFGDKKNVDVITKNLNSLRKIFEDSFEVASVLRQVIIKIVNQLSNLPTASPSSPGLNIDVDVPGGRLKQSARASRIGNIARMGAIAGSGLLALGGGASIAETGMRKAKEYQEGLLFGGVSPSSGEQYIPENIVESFSVIVDRFVSAVDSLISGAKSSSGSGGTSGGGATSTKTSSDISKTSTSTISSAPGDEKLAAFVASMEASSPENAADALQVMLNRTASGYSKQGLAGVISGREQFSPLSAAIYGTSRDENAARKYGPISKRLPGNTPQEKFNYLQKVASEPDGLAKLQQIFGGGSSSVAATILNDPKYLEMSRKNVKGALNFGAKSIAQPGDVRIRPGGNYFYNFTGKLGTLTYKPTSNIQSLQTSSVVLPTTGEQIKSAATVKPSTTQSQATQARAQSISQPAQQVPQTISLPPTVIDAGGGKSQEQTPQAPVTVPTQPSGSGPEVPFLPTTNPENFFTMYSRIVYNIVDG